MTTPLLLRNGQPAAIDDVPLVDITAFRKLVLDAVADDQRVASLFAREERGAIELVVILANDASSELGAARSRLEGDSYEALTPQCAQVHLFEREIAEQYGINPVGHPWLKPVRFQKSWRPG
ncbi:MAG: NADH-quinone oxidoreductase subunit C, partial [Thermoanaerobaculia bacterium]